MNKNLKQLSMSFTIASGKALDRIGYVFYNVIRGPNESDSQYRMRIVMVAYQQKPIDGNDILKELCEKT